MASSGCRAGASSSVALTALLLVAGACTTTSGPDSTLTATSGTAAPRETEPGSAFRAGVELPAGAGREILITACLNCHELTALALFSDFYGRASWRSLIVSMQANGAEVAGPDIDVLAAYLAEHFGTGAP